LRKATFKFEFTKEHFQADPFYFDDALKASADDGR